MESIAKSVYDLADELCTVKEIHALLKRAEGHPKVKLTAKNRSTFIQKNLRDAVEGNAVSIQSVYDLVREAEENGNQHVFYYQPASPETIDVTIAAVGLRLFGKAWQSKMQEPSFDLEPGKFRFADFRQWDTNRKPFDWCLKIYGLQFFEEQQGEDEKLDEKTVRRTFTFEPRRLVLFVRWNSPDLLEVRIPQASSKRRVKEWLDQAWAMLAPVFRSDEFRPWVLDTARRSLIFGQTELSGTYRFSHSRLEDENHNQISVNAAHTERSLEASTPIGKSLQAMAKPGVGECRFLRLTWLGKPDEIPASDLVSYLGGFAENEVAIGRQCSAQEIDFVTDRLREFSKPNPAV